MGIDDEIAAALRFARETCGKPLDERWTRAVARLVEHEIHLSDLRTMEAGMADIPATVFVAYARLAEQPVSSILGELAAYTTITSLERRLGELEARLEAAGLGPV